MPYLTPVTIAYAAYVVAGVLCLLLIATVLAWLAVEHARGQLPSRRLVRQELIWTLVPALVLVGLTVIGDIPQGLERIVAGERVLETRAPSK